MISLKKNLRREKIPYLPLGLLFAELAPVAAIVGGILGQEVLTQQLEKVVPNPFTGDQSHLQQGCSTQ